MYTVATLQLALSVTQRQYYEWRHLLAIDLLCGQLMTILYAMILQRYGKYILSRETI